jgi:hypothetical protein
MTILIKNFNREDEGSTLLRSIGFHQPVHTAT